MYLCIYTRAHKHMNTSAITYAIAIVVIIFIVYKLTTWNVGANEDYLYGFWVAEGDEFCDNAEIESILVFMGESENGFRSNTRTCYIIIMNDMCNQGFVLNYVPGWAGVGVGKYHVRASVTFDDEQIWTDYVNIHVDMRTGTMEITSDDGDVVYARLCKQHDTTNMAREAEDAELVG